MASVAAFVAPAHAAPEKQLNETTTRQGMNILHATKVEKAASGEARVTLSDGNKITVSERVLEHIKVDTHVAPTSVPIVYGNCGYSFVYEDAVGNRAVTLCTGFHVTTPAVDFSWTVQLDDRGGTSYRRYGHPISGQDWTDNRVIGGLTKGGARATVLTTSFAVLGNGDICSSGGPWDNTTIT